MTRGDVLLEGDEDRRVEAAVVDVIVMPRRTGVVVVF
jgi:hypothetical protein